MTSPRPDARPRALLTLASLAIALAAADTYVVVLALTEMMQGVGVGVESLQRAAPIISGFLLGYVAVLPLIGRLADLVDRQRVLLGCLAIFVVGSGVTALATDLPVLVAGRVVQGVGGGGLVPATLAIVAALWPPEARGMPLGIVGAVQEFGSVVGPVLGAAILAVADWRAIFWLNAIAGILLAIAIARAGRASGAAAGGAAAGEVSGRHTTGSRAAWVVWGGALGVLWMALAAPEIFATSVALGGPWVNVADTTARLATPIGFVALALVAGALMWSLWRAWPSLRAAGPLGAALLGGVLGSVILTFAAAEPEKEIVGPLGYALLPVGVLCAAGYAVLHRRSDNPVIPHGVLGGRTSWALLVSFCVGAALVAIIVNIPLLTRLAHPSGDGVPAYTDAEGALVLLRFLLAVPVGALVGGWALRRLGDGLVAMIGLACAAVGLALMTAWGRGIFATFVSVIVLAATGFGIGLTLAPVNNAALAAVRADAHGAASALVVVARMVGMVLGLALLTAYGLHRYYGIVAGLPDPTDKEALKTAAILQVHAVFWGAAVAAALGALASIRLGLRRVGQVEGQPTFGL
ncbi:MAG: MFS transporter [Actinobacteria bacterium]|nr:MFS transporter [Actinomycetota bacterium]